MNQKISTSIKKCIISFKYAKNGLLHAVLNENNFTYHFIATIIVIACGFIFRLTNHEWILVTILIGIVLIAEIFNTAIEKAVDLVSPGFNPKAGLIKDIAAGGVLLASIVSATAGLLLFIGKIL